MEQIFHTLTELALDPFAQPAAVAEARRALLGSGSSVQDLEASLGLEPEVVANGGFASCETCIDPGGDDPDPFP